MTAGNEAIGKVVLVEPGEELGGARGVAPVTHEIADNSKGTDELDARVLHAVIGSIADESGGGSRGFDVGPDAVSLGAEGESEESGALTG